MNQMGSGRVIARVVPVCALLAILLAVPACASRTPKPSGPQQQPRGTSMAGPAQKVVVSRSAVENRPKTWDLGTPESAVRSYLDWMSYAYRIGSSEVATPTMSSHQEVRVDSYNQMNLENGRLLDQTLTSLTLGAPAVEGTRTLVPAKEEWTYRYVSIKEAGKTLQGPFSASYETTYSLIRAKNGWLVDDVAVKALGTVK